MIDSEIEMQNLAEAPRNTHNKRSLIRTSHVCHRRYEYKYTHTYTYTHIHIHTHTHTHTHTLTQTDTHTQICQTNQI